MALYAKLLAEFIGTFMLVFTVGCNAIQGSSPIFAVISIACVLMVSVYALGQVSGANLNPAVSLTLGISRKLEWSSVLLYILVQLAAGALAALAFGGLTEGSMPAGAPGPSKGFSLLQASAAEALYTFMLCFVVINVAATEATEGNDNYGLAIGFVIVAGGYGAGALSGGCFNPAVALGVAVSGAASDPMSMNYINFLAYAGAEIAGAVLASALYWVCRQPGAVAELVSEFLGTYFLVLTVGLAVMAASPAAAFAIAASLTCMVYALSSVSGAHFNPAVTVAILLSCRGLITMVKAPLYVVAQLLGGLAASFTYKQLASNRPVPTLAPESIKDAMGAEFVFTFLLAFVVLSVATTATPAKEAYGLAIGSCVTAGGYAVGRISGGRLNPAVSLGVAVGGHVGVGHAGVLGYYVAAQLAASVLAAGLFRATRPDEYGGKAREASAEGGAPLYLKMDA